MNKISKEQYENDMELMFKALVKIMDKLKIKPDKDETIYLRAKEQRK